MGKRITSTNSANANRIVRDGENCLRATTAVVPHCNPDCRGRPPMKSSFCYEKKNEQPKNKTILLLQLLMVVCLEGPVFHQQLPLMPMIPCPKVAEEGEPRANEHHPSERPRQTPQVVHRTLSGRPRYLRLCQHINSYQQQQDQPRTTP